jgi:hypothetical protein
VADKLPSTSSRLEPAGLSGRIVSAGVGGAVLARGARWPVPPIVLVAVASALAAARIGHDLRVAAAEQIPGLAAATKDAVALSLAAASTSF